MDSLKNIERLPNAVRKKFTPFAHELLRLHHGNIVSIFIYGSSVSGDYIPGTYGISSAVVFKRLGCEELKKSLRIIDKGIRNKISAPLFISPEHIESSLDTFPLEFLEMRETHILIYGEDILHGLQVDPTHIRFICEEKIKGALIRIRQAYLEVGLRRKGIEALIKESLNSLLPAFRGLLRLKNTAVPAKKEELLLALGEAFNVDAGTFIAVLKDKEDDERIGGMDIEEFLSKYITQVESLAEISDKFPDTGSV